uniref:Retrotransposon gag domain-containing protein n=1 Tax=Lygus hesperus TaxID=30085 RepID=A0A146M3T7_LYGHE
MNEGAGPIREVLAALPVAHELEVCQRKAADLSALVEGIEGDWTCEEVRKIEAKTWHLYKRVVVLEGTAHQNDVRDHLAESVALLQTTLMEEKGKLVRRRGVGNTPPPSSPALPDAVEEEEEERGRRLLYGLEATPPLTGFQLEEGSDTRFTVKTQDVSNQFVQSNAYLRRLQHDQRKLLLKGVYLTEPQTAAVGDLVGRVTEKINSSVDRTGEEVCKLGKMLQECMGVLLPMQRQHSAMLERVVRLEALSQRLLERVGQIDAAFHQGLAVLDGSVQSIGTASQQGLASLGQATQELLRAVRELRPAEHQPTPQVHQSQRIIPAASQQLPGAADPSANTADGYLNGNPTFIGHPSGASLQPQLHTGPGQPNPALGRRMTFTPPPPPPPDLMSSPLPNHLHHPMATYTLHPQTSEVVASINKAVVNGIGWYNGSSKTGSAEAWVAQIRNLKRLRELGGEYLAERIWVQAAISRAQGESALFLQRHQSKLATLDDLEVALQRRFEGIRTLLSYTQELEQAEMGPKETITQYGERMKTLAERANPDQDPDHNQVALQAFLRGLPQEIGMSTATQGPSTITEAMTKAQAAMFMCEAVRSRSDASARGAFLTAAIQSHSGQAGNPPSPDMARERQLRTQEERSASSQQGQARSNAKPSRPKYCSICRIQGHQSRECEYRIGGPRYGELPPSRTDLMAPPKEGKRTNSPNGKRGGAPK